jgi:hypothetical protein
MTRPGYALVFIAILCSLACSSPQPRQAAGEEKAPEPAEEDLARARSAADALSKQLAAQLFAELDRSGPLGAIEVCSRVAQETARALSSESLSVRRVSSRPRNPADEPDDWERSQLESLERLRESGTIPDEVVGVVEAAAGHELRYLRPLRIAPPCLTCHGDREAMDVQLVERIEELYPGDRAIGYVTGDLRGAVSVRLTLDAAGSGADDL